MPPLGLPPENATLSAEGTLDFPAVRLFVERATASGAQLDRADATAATIADICRKLDGMALAIELAAGRVEAYGLQQIAGLLDARFTLLWPGQRTAPARQKTLRAALEWCFGDDGNIAAGVRLASAAAPVFFAMSLLTECQSWAQRAILALDRATLGGRQEMRLQAALALASLWTRGNSEATFAALNRSTAIARQLEDPLNQILLLAPLHVFHMRMAEFGKAMRCAQQVVELAQTTDDPAAAALARILLGYSLHFAGDLPGARRELEAALRQMPGTAPGSQAPAGMQEDAMAAPILALAWSAAPSALARTLWLQGHPAAALDCVRRTIAAVASARHPVTLLVALMHAVAVHIWNGDLDDADAQIAGFVASAEAHDLAAHILLGRCFQGQSAISRGDSERGIALLQAALHALRARRYELFTTSFNISLAQGLMATGRHDEGVALIEATIQAVAANGDTCYMPELLRVKANLLTGLPGAPDDLAQACYAHSLALSRRQGALAWELRTSIDLARHAAAEANPERAKTLLQPVVERFADGAGTADLMTARSLLAAWT